MHALFSLFFPFPYSEDARKGCRSCSRNACRSSEQYDHSEWVRYIRPRCVFCRSRFQPDDGTKTNLPCSNTHHRTTTSQRQPLLAPPSRHLCTHIPPPRPPYLYGMCRTIEPDRKGLRDSGSPPHPSTCTAATHTFVYADMSLFLYICVHQC